MILIDICGKGGVYSNKEKYRELISGEIFEGDIHVDPYRVMVLEKINN